MRKVIEMLVGEAVTRDIPQVVPRQISIQYMPGKAAVLIGMRRTGKTWLCFQTMRSLMASGVAREKLLYLNFEDDRLANLTINDLQWITEAYYNLFPELKREKCWFFFDEIQRVEQWELFIRRLLDSENAVITLTGSSAKLLSREIGTAMRGRALVTEVFPLSFREYCSFNKIKLPSRKLYSSSDRHRLLKASEGYLECGGFPEVQHCGAELRRNILQGYVDVVLLRDVIERYKLGNYTAARSFARHILQNPGQQLSVTRLATTFSQNGIACSKNLLFELLEYLHDAFFCYPVEIHDRSFKRRQVNPKKVYTADSGMCQAFSTNQTKDLGTLLEGVVFNALRGQQLAPDYMVTPEKREVDFVFQQDGRWRLIQVCWSLADPVTRKREMEALSDAMQLYPDAKCTIVTWNDHEDDNGIQIIPLWRWLLEGGQKF
jgi:predicted AAA+ superfamily ATPase